MSSRAIVEADDVPPALAATGRDHEVLDETETDDQETVAMPSSQFSYKMTDQVPLDYRDYGRDREDTRRDRERGDRDRDHRPRDGPRDRDDAKGRGESSKHDDSRRSDKPKELAQKDVVSNDTGDRIPRSTRPNLDPDAPDDVQDEADEAIDDPDEDAMMAMMGLGGFGSTKGKHVDGNQEGTANVKKTRTWRQYMNRRGGFNRPLDKIK
ncbi:uncharacterized protein ARMOST_03578 [Armillaria ostoyae]|uniref:U4/U6.U5 small nuclear ribonucleoprotein 27kDa protein domain-containing protein n=1 Tax=Armillaria ostoyae TaxID=47428 RepID=A0A284QUY0_ARMOS|nr:uncharacterized protein ARMOST_03578 [Armillaria ostoyae]